MTRYKLLQDLPGIEAGAIYQLEHESAGRFYIPMGPYYHFLDKSAVGRLRADVIENNPDWFQKIEEPIKITISGKEYGLREVPDYEPIQINGKYYVLTPVEK